MKRGRVGWDMVGVEFDNDVFDFFVCARFDKVGEDEKFRALDVKFEEVDVAF